MQERLLDPNQPGFCPSDFCINQLFAINMKYLKRLTVIQLQRLDQSFQIYQKHLTKCGMKACFLNLGPWVSQVSFIIFLVTIFQIDSKELLESRVILIHQRFINYLQLHMKYLKRLTVIQLQRLDQSFQIYQKHLTKCGMKACFLNLGPWVSQVSFIIFLVTIFQIDSKEFLESRVILIHQRFTK